LVEPSFRTLVRLARALIGVLALTTLGGCTATPWVKPYERERLADPIMSFTRNPASSAYMQHVFETREGARGATGAVGGGCGCN
jgi:Domain of unknown function (DUF4266)